MLFHLHAAGEPLGVSSLGRALGLPRSTVHRLLAPLRRRGLVERDGDRSLPPRVRPRRARSRRPAGRPARRRRAAGARGRSPGARRDRVPHRRARRAHRRAREGGGPRFPAGGAPGGRAPSRYTRRPWVSSSSPSRPGKWSSATSTLSLPPRARRRRPCAREVELARAPRLRGEPRRVDPGARCRGGARARRPDAMAGAVAIAAPSARLLERRSPTLSRRAACARRSACGAALGQRVRGSEGGEHPMKIWIDGAHRGRGRGPRLGARSRLPVRRRRLRGHPRLRRPRLPPRRSPAPPRDGCPGDRPRAPAAASTPMRRIVLDDGARARRARRLPAPRRLARRGRARASIPPAARTPRIVCIAARVRIYPPEKLARGSRPRHLELAAPRPRRRSIPA